MNKLFLFTKTLVEGLKNREISQRNLIGGGANSKKVKKSLSRFREF